MNQTNETPEQSVARWKKNFEKLDKIDWENNLQAFSKTLEGIPELLTLARKKDRTPVENALMVRTVPKLQEAFQVYKDYEFVLEKKLEMEPDEKYRNIKIRFDKLARDAEDSFREVFKVYLKDISANLGAFNH